MNREHGLKRTLFGGWTLVLLALLGAGCPSGSGPSNPSGPTATSTHTSTITMTLTAVPQPTSVGCLGFGTSEAGTYPGGVGGSANRLALHTLASTSAVTAIAFPLHFEGMVTASGGRAAIYSDSGGPDLLLTQSFSTTLDLVEGWNVIPVAPVVLAPGNYWLAATVDVAPANYNFLTTTDTPGLAAVGNWSSGFPYPFTGGFATGNAWAFKALCGPAPTATETFTPTETESRTATSSATGSPTSTATPTPTRTLTSTLTITLTATVTATLTSTPLCNYGHGTPVFTPSLGGDYGAGTMICAFHHVDIAGPVTSTALRVGIHSIFPTPGVTPMMRMALYSDSGGFPGARFGASNLSPQPVTVGWNEFDIPDTQWSGPFDCWVCYKPEVVGIFVGVGNHGGGMLKLDQQNLPSVLAAPTATVTPMPPDPAVGVLVCPQ